MMVVLKGRVQLYAQRMVVESAVCPPWLLSHLVDVYDHIAEPVILAKHEMIYDSYSHAANNNIIGFPRADSDIFKLLKKYFCSRRMVLW